VSITFVENNFKKNLFTTKSSAVYYVLIITDQTSSSWQCYVFCGSEQCVWNVHQQCIIISKFLLDHAQYPNPFTKFVKKSCRVIQINKRLDPKTEPPIPVVGGVDNVCMLSTGNSRWSVIATEYQ